MKKAYIELIDSVLPVRVTFPTNVGEYIDIAHAMIDIKLFGCEPVFCT